MYDIIREAFRPEGYREIDESRWYLIKVIEELYNSKKRTTLRNVRQTVLRRIGQKPMWKRKFYLGYQTTIEDIINGMYENGVLEFAPRSYGVRNYKLTLSGKDALKYFESQMKIFK